MDEHIRLLIRSLGEDRVKLNIDLSEYMETGLGGIAQSFYIATTTREFIKVIQLCRELKLKFLIIGSGSKMAISESGVKGVTIKNRSDNLNVFGIKGKVSRSGIGIEEAFLEADSGASLIKLAEFANKQGLGGFEDLESTPGTVGGSLHILSTLQDKAHQVKVLNNKGDSATKRAQEVARGDIILSVVFKLKARKS